MKSNVVRRFGALLATAGLVAGLVFVAPAAAVLAGITSPACAFADSETATECVISLPWTIGGGGVAGNNFTPALPGPYAFHKDLHITTTGALRAIGTAGITLNIDGATGGTGALIMDAGASVIDTNEDGAPPNDGAGPLTITATGGAQLAAGSTIRAQNTSQAGNAGNITLTLGASSSLGGTISSEHTSGADGNGGDIRIFVTGNLTVPTTGLITSSKAGDSFKAGDIRITVSGDMLMQGTGTVATSARILAKHLAATNGTPGGNIRIDVGTGDQGVFTMQTGTRVDSGSQGFAGNIWIKAGDKVNVNDGAAVLAGQRSEQDTRGHGGRIFVTAGCEANIFGTLSSQGKDPGADLVHVEGCLVHVGPNGLVESTGSGHQPATPVSCDGTDDDNTSVPGAPPSEFNQPGEVFRTDHLATASFCVEIWARHVTIDAGGEVNVDFALSGGIDGSAWVDVFAEQDITINGPAVAPYAIHGNSGLGDDTGSNIRIKAQSSFVSLSGLAVQANALPATGTGGTVEIEAGGNVALDAASVQARGTAGVGTGGTISGRSFNGSLTGILPGELNTGGGTVGTVTLQRCLGVVADYSGNVIGTLVTPPNACGGQPSFPAYVVFDPAGRWTRCGNSTISGTKWLDKNGNGVRNLPDDVGLSGWTIHLFNATFHATQVTALDGSYTFSSVPSGTFNVCEQLLVAVPAWSQSFPAAGVDCVAAVDPAADNPTPGKWGYSVTIDNSLCCTGQKIEGKDFGNFQNATKSGVKWNDVNGNGIRDAGDDPLNGWVIHLFGTSGAGAAVHQTATTAGAGPAGAYSFSVPPGTYTVCETLQPNYTQTFPTGPASATIADCDGPPNPDADNLTPGPWGYAIVLTSGQADTDNDFGNFTQTFRAPDKSGMKFNDLNGNHLKDAGEPGLANWPINLYGPGPGFAFSATTNTAADGTYHFIIPSAGDWRVCEGPAPVSLPGAWVQTFPQLITTPPNPGETIGSFCPGPNTIGYQFTVPADGGSNLVNNDFGNFIPKIECPEDPGRAAALTRVVVSQSKYTGSGGGVAGNPKQYLTVQEAYNVAKASGQAETIGLFANTSENLYLNGTKSLTITQCTVAKVTAADSTKPVWSITSTGKLTIIGPDSVGGTVGWLVAGNGGHTLKSIRANGASVQGVLITSSGNSVGWNDVSGNGNNTATAAGIRVEGGSNILKGGSVLSNNGDGVQLVGASNSLSGSKIQSNTRNGVIVTGKTNTVSDNKNTISNGADGFNFGAFAANMGTKVKGNEASNNTGNEFTIGANNTDQGGNKKNGSSFTFGTTAVNFN